MCEAVAPLATRLKQHRITGRRQDDEQIEDDEDGSSLDDIVLPVAVKSAVLGVRPIVLAGTVGQIGAQVGEVIDQYAQLFKPAVGRPSLATIAEGDVVMRQILQSLVKAGRLPTGLRVESASMRRIKGLERPLVLWSTRAEIPLVETAPEWIYTILTRTTGVVVIALSEHTPTHIKTIVGHLDSTRLLFWTQHAENEFRRWQGLVGGADDQLA